MQYLVITKFGQYQIDADDFDDAVQQAYDNNTGYRDVVAIIKIES